MSTQATIPVIEKMMSVLEYLEEHPDGVALSELVRSLNIPKTTAYRIVNTLQLYHVIKSDDGHYALGPRLVGLANSVKNNSDIVSVSRPIMERVANNLHEMCKLSVRVQDLAVVLAVAQSPRGFYISTEIGHCFPLHVGAASKVLMAYMPEPEFERVLEKGLQAYTSETIVDPSILRQTLKEIRDQGWAQDQGEYLERVRAIAAPVYDASKKVVAALSVAFFAESNEDRHEEIRRVTIDAARSISGALGASVRMKAWIS